eukprot:TRINITY_DN4147_c0_g1_i1.p1 TRINITY_DN4147_c0_g1~~TRINITY_DN4147_c0_g1_i1.p1  ORF type:complete len:105 (-),score=4.18 TRINITY_DN4147_c0_g1_i1:344-658(-)
MGITTGVRNLLSRVNPFASGMVVLNSEVNPPENKEGTQEEDASKRAIALARRLNVGILTLCTMCYGYVMSLCCHPSNLVQHSSTLRTSRPLHFPHPSHRLPPSP